METTTHPTEAEKAFLAELSALSEKHGIKIGACGCCGSPWLIELEAKDRGGAYTVQSDSDYLVWCPVTAKSIAPTRI